MKETTRIQMDLPHASLERLKALREKTEAVSYAEVTKNAYKLYERMIELSDEGCQILIRDREGRVRELELFL